MILKIFHSHLKDKKSIFILYRLYGDYFFFSLCSPHFRKVNQTKKSNHMPFMKNYFKRHGLDL